MDLYSRVRRSALRGWRAVSDIGGVSVGRGVSVSAEVYSAVGGGVARRDHSGVAAACCPSAGSSSLKPRPCLISVLSTKKCSYDSSGLTSGCDRIAAITLRDISVISGRSRLSLNTVGLRPGASPVQG